jgi:hypothetical protein
VNTRYFGEDLVAWEAIWLTEEGHTKLDFLFMPEDEEAEIVELMYATATTRPAALLRIRRLDP